MKKIFLLFLFFTGMVAEDLNPNTYNMNEVYNFCTDSYSTRGINLVIDKSENQKICKERMAEVIDFYKAECENGDADKCFVLSLIYNLDEPFYPEKDFKISLNYGLKGCNLGHKIACDIVGNRYHFLFRHETNKKLKKEYKKKSKEYYKKSCKLGYRLGCADLKNKF